MKPQDVLAQLWSLTDLPRQVLGQVSLTGDDPVLPSSFYVGTAAQTSIAAAALAACELGHLRGQPRQHVAVDMAHAALECSGWFSLDGRVPKIWDKFSGLYRCSDGWVRIHANFAHHRAGALRLMGLDPVTASRADAEQALLAWSAVAFETAAANAGLVVAAVRSFAEWDAQPPGQAIAAQPLMHFERIGDAAPHALEKIPANQLPLAGLRVLDLTRILAGPVCGRMLAGLGADVMLVNSPHLPNIESIADTSRGKLSCHIDLKTPGGVQNLQKLAAQAHVFVQGYRPGGLHALGFGPQQLAALNPGIVVVSLSAYGTQGAWAPKRGFDSLVQTATGFNHAEMQASGANAPKALPMQILDYATGHLMAFAAAAALHRQQREGGSWNVTLSLAQTGLWLRAMGRIADGFGVSPPGREPFVETSESGFGQLQAIRLSAQLQRTALGWRRRSMPPGSHAAIWP